MDTYKIRPDGIKYQELDLEISDIIDDFPEEVSLDDAHDFSKLNLSLANWWKPVSTEFIKIEEGGDQIPDLSKWIDATLVLSPLAHEVLEDLLAPHGEFVRVFVDGEKFCIFNCLEMVDVDKENSECDELGLPKKLAFNRKDIQGKHIFKTSFDHCGFLYCSGELKKRIDQSRLKGIVFDSDIANAF